MRQERDFWGQPQTFEYLMMIHGLTEKPLTH
jgi:hypothetical protein